MGKAKRLKRRRKEKKSFEEAFSDGLTSNFIKGIKNSPMWDEMVEEFGEKRELELLNECKAEIKIKPDKDRLCLPPGMSRQQ